MKYEVKEDCYCEHYLHESTNYPRKGLVEKKLKKGDIVDLKEKWSNLYGTYMRVLKDNVEYDIFPKHLKLISKGESNG